MNPGLMAEPDPGAVRHRSDFVAFVRSLSEQDPNEMANPDTAQFLTSLADYVEDTSSSLNGTWVDLALALYAGAHYGVDRPPPRG